MKLFKPVLNRKQVEAIKSLQQCTENSNTHSHFSIIDAVQAMSRDGICVTSYEHSSYECLNDMSIAAFAAAMYGDYDIAQPTPHEKLAEVYAEPPLANDPKMFVEARYYRKGIEAALYILNIKVKGINDYDGGCATTGNED